MLLTTSCVWVLCGAYHILYKHTALLSLVQFLSQLQLLLSAVLAKMMIVIKDSES